MALQTQSISSRPGDVLSVIHDFAARTEDELTLKRGDRIELIERDDDFGDGWFLGKHLKSGETGLFPEVYTRLTMRSASQFQVKDFAQIPMVTSQHEKGSKEKASSEALSEALSSIVIAKQTAKAAPDSAAVQALVPTPSPSSTSSTAQQAASNSSFPRLAKLGSTGQRSLSLGSAMHQNSTVMNETLSVIEEHITDMGTPRHSLLGANRNHHYSGHDNGYDVPRRLSYINGHETDEEEEEDAVVYTEKEVRLWTPHQVAEHLEELGADTSQCQVFREQEINGEVLLGMDRETLLLKDFELGTLGRRLALWQKIQRFQADVRGSRPIRSPSNNSYMESTRSRSSTVGTVLPKIPSLVEDSASPQLISTTHERLSSRSSLQDDDRSAALEPTKSAAQARRPSAASIRSLAHNRRHSSAEYGSNAAAAPPNNTASLPATASHVKNGSFDRSWTMRGGNPPTLSAPHSASGSAHATSPSIDSAYLVPPTPPELAMTVVNSVDLDRGYFSGNEVETRKIRNVLKKRDSPTHARAPSDGYNTMRLSQVFRHIRSGSTDSVNEGSDPSSPPLNPSLKGVSRSAGSTGSKQMHQHSPSVTKLEYGSTPSIDTLATSTTTTPGSDAARPKEKSGSSFTLQARAKFHKTRLTGLRAISDAVTNSEKAIVASPTDIDSSTISRDSPIHTPSRTESSTPSIASKTTSMDEKKSPKPSVLPTAKYVTFPVPVTVPKRKAKQETSAYVRGLEKRTPTEQIAGADYSGWMKKKSKKLGKWHPRLFVLRGRRLSYYYSEDDTEEKGLIDISFHRVLPANKDLMTGFHAAITGAGSSPTSPPNSSLQTSSQTNSPTEGIFIFKLVPPRPGLSKAVNFTLPKVHFFAVNSLQEGRNWMAALMKATIERDEARGIVSTYREKTISLSKAQEMRVRPQEFAGTESDADGLGIKTAEAEVEKPKEGTEEASSDVVGDGDGKSSLEGRDKSLEKVKVEVAA